MRPGLWQPMPAWLVTALFWLAMPALALAAARQGANGITSPASGDTVSGVVIVQGTAAHGDFLRYELAFFQEFNPLADWIVFAEGDQPVVNGTLAVWDTTVGRSINAPVFPDGVYRLRLRVVRHDFNYDEYFVSGILVSNEGPTPTPTPSPSPTGATITPLPSATLLPGGQPAVLPSLTPFPTPTPLATPERAPAAGNERANPAGSSNGRGIFAQLTAIDTGQFSRAFWQGVRWAGMAFAGLAAYLFLRALWRFLKRQVLGRLWR